MEYYSAPKKNESLSFSGKCKKAENIMLNKVSQVQKDKTKCFLSYVEDRSKSKYKHCHVSYMYRTRFQWWDCYRGLGEEGKKKRKIESK
jgi:hypothetical protein